MTYGNLLFLYHFYVNVVRPAIAKYFLFLSQNSTSAIIGIVVCCCWINGSLLLITIL